MKFLIPKRNKIFSCMVSFCNFAFSKNIYYYILSSHNLKKGNISVPKLRKLFYIYPHISIIYILYSGFMPNYGIVLTHFFIIISSIPKYIVRYVVDVIFYMCFSFFFLPLPPFRLVAFTYI